MGELVTASARGDKTIKYEFIDGVGQAFRLRVGSKSEEHRQVLKRYWLRNGGTEEVFDRLLPPVKAPQSKSAR